MTTPSINTYKGMPTPFWFYKSSADAFRHMNMEPSDVILSSGAKFGTTWVNKICRLLLHGDDCDFSLYPDSVPLDKDELNLFKNGTESQKKQVGFSEHFCGSTTFQDLLQQAKPRFFCTHLHGKDQLPLQLFGNDKEEGKGRLIIVLRNLKDAMVSLHYFKGEAKDGWLGNEHGIGSFNRFVDENCPNAFGSCFDWIKKSDDAVQVLRSEPSVESGAKKPRVLVLYYEQLKFNLPSELQRINDFLELPPLSDAKKEELVEKVSFTSMRSGADDRKKGLDLWRKGEIGDWKNYLSGKEWETIDEIFEKKLGNVEIAQPLRYYHQMGISGCPTEKRIEWTLEKTDPRTWPVFLRAAIQEGMVVPDNTLQKIERQGTFYHRPSEIKGEIPSEEFSVEPNRYHLFVSGTCPWASSTVSARHLLGLEDVISMDIADGQSSAGWVYLDGSTAEPWNSSDNKPFFLHEAYRLHDSAINTRITVPVLWDKKTRKIVSNDSWGIIKILSNEFAPLGKRASAPASNGDETGEVLATNEDGHPTLFPKELESDIESLHSDIMESLLRAVYRAGFGYMKNKDVANDMVRSFRKEIYDTLSNLDDLLSKKRFLMGEQLTAPDLRLAMTLLRWDSSYRHGFCLLEGRGGILLGDGYPNLKAFVRDIYKFISPTVDFCAYRQYYRIRQSLHLEFDSGKDITDKEDGETIAPLPDLKAIFDSVSEPAGSRRPAKKHQRE